MKSSLILIVEDNPITRKMVRVALQAEGYSVVEAPDGRTALAQVATQPPDLIIQDLLLPDMDGLDLIKQLRASPACAEIPVLAFSGFLSKMEQARTLEAGFTDYLFKPVDPSRLVETVQAHLLPAKAYLLPTKSKERHGQGRRILAVDDDPIQLKLLKIALETRGFIVETARDGAEALEQARKSPPSAIVSDILMPRLDGFRLCSAVRRDPHLGRIPVVLASSSYVEEADRQLSRAVGASAFVLRTPDFREGVEALFAGLDGEAPASVELPPDELIEGYVHRVVRQLEHQVGLNLSLASRLALRQAELSILSGIDESLKKSAKLETTLPELFYRCLDSAGASKGAVYLLEPDGRLALGAQSGYPDSDAVGSFFGHAEVLRLAIESEHPVRVPSPRLADNEARDLLDRAKARSMLIAPVGAHGERLGALMMASGEKVLSDDWVSFVQAIAIQIGHAVALMKAYEEAERRRIEAEVLADLVAKISASLDLDTILRRVAEAAKELCHSDQAVIALRDLSSEAMVFRYWAEARYGRHPGLRIERGKGSGGQVLLTGQPFRTDNHATDPRIAKDHLESIGENRVIAQLVVPIRAQDRIDGLLYAENSSPRRFTERDEAVLLRLAHHAAIAIQNARQREALYQSEKLSAMGSLLAGVAHELNNPLAIILGQIALSESEIAGTRVQPRIEKVAKAAERCTRIVKNFLALARRSLPERQAVSLNNVVKETLELLAYPLRVDDVEVTLDLASELPTLWADPHQLQQVVVNLVTNAHHAMRESAPRRLTMTTQSNPQRSRVHFEVADTGPGIPAEIQSRIFEPFFTTKPTGEGTGLGLSLCVGIIQEHGGRIEVDSEPGQTVFRVELPVETPQQDLREATSTEPAGGITVKTVLIVDDDPDVLDVLADLLSGTGYRVETAENGAIALQKLTDRDFDAVLSDMRMPRLDGPGLYRALEGPKPHLLKRLIFITGDGLNTRSREWLEEMNVPHLGKPFDFDDVRRAVREVVNQARRTEGG